MSRRPLIGVTTTHRRSMISWHFNRFAVWRAGGWPVRITAQTPYDLDTLDGLVIGGGDDIAPHLYGGDVHVEVRVDPERDRLELDLLDAVLPAGRMPVLGICRGSQMINIYYGGSLHAHIYDVYASARKMRTPLPRKTVDILNDSRLREVLGVSWCRVNSLHHQSVDRTGKDIAVVARDRDGIVQGIEGRKHPYLVGVQWHPEFLVFNRSQQRLFRSFVRAARTWRPA